MPPPHSCPCTNQIFMNLKCMLTELNMQIQKIWLFTGDCIWVSTYYLFPSGLGTMLPISNKKIFNLVKIPKCWVISEWSPIFLVQTEGTVFFFSTMNSRRDLKSAEARTMQHYKRFHHSPLPFYWTSPSLWRSLEECHEA